MIAAKMRCENCSNTISFRFALLGIENVIQICLCEFCLPFILANLTNLKHIQGVWPNVHGNLLFPLTISTYGKCKAIENGHRLNESITKET